MARKASKTPHPGLDNGNLALARTILEALNLKEEAGLVRNPFTGRPCYKLTDREAAQQAAPGESTAELAALILETREEAFIDWARRIQDRQELRTSEGSADEASPPAKKSKRSRP